MAEHPQDTFIHVHDFLNIFKRGKNTLFIGALTVSTLLCGYQLQCRPFYEAEASFREKQSNGPKLGPASLTAIFFQTQGSDSHATTMMRSRLLARDIVKAFGLQANLSEVSFPKRKLLNIKENALSEIAIWRDSLNPSLLPKPARMQIKSVEYDEETPLNLSIIFEEEDSFKVFSKEGQLYGTGTLEHPFATNNVRFTLTRKKHSGLLEGSIFSLSFKPLEKAIDTFSNQLSIDTDKDDGSLLKLRYKHPDRHQAAAILNTLMALYHNYLENEQELLANKQIAYLHKREKEMEQKLETIVNRYADKIAEDVSTIGFADSENALLFLNHQLRLYRKKSYNIDLELKRLQKLQTDPLASHDNVRYLAKKNPEYINTIITELRSLQQESDRLELALHHQKEASPYRKENALKTHLTNHEKIRRSLQDTQYLIEALEQEQFPLPKVALAEEKKYMITHWIDALNEGKKDIFQAPAEIRKRKEEEWEVLKGQFATYLNNLLHFLSVNEKTIEEKLSHQQEGFPEFEGVTLETAQDFYRNYNRERSDIEIKILQNRYLIEQLKNPLFELSSLSTTVKDPITLKMIQQASDSLLAMRNDQHYSEKERQRLHSLLEGQRHFISTHLEQAIDLLELQQAIIEEKITAVQQASLALTQQQISILYKQLSDASGTYHSNLSLAKQLLEEQQHSLQKEMAFLPKKWATEKMIDQQLQVHGKIVEEVAKLVDGKVIAANLDTILSTPIDRAHPPLYPRPPKVLFFAIVGAFLGLTAAGSLLLVKTLYKGVPLSKESIQLMGYHAIEEKSGLEQVTAFAESKQKETGATTLLFCSPKNGAIQALEVASQLSKQQQERTLCIDLAANEKSTEPFQKEETLDYLPYELKGPLSKKELERLLSNFTKDYSWIVIASEASPFEFSTSSLFPTADILTLNVGAPPLEEQKKLVNHLKNGKKIENTLFIVNQEPSHA